MMKTAHRLSLFAVILAGACAEPASRMIGPEEGASLDRGGSNIRVPGTLVYGLTEQGELVTFGTAQPNRIISSVPVSGLQSGERLVGIDFRASDLAMDGVDYVGRLYGVSTGSSGGAIYLIDPQTGAATGRRALVTSAGESVALSGTSFGVGFNPVVDRLRVHGDAEQNLRINVDNGVTIVDAPLAYLGGDQNAGANPDVTGTAYTNSDASAATGTTLYAIDAARDVLVGFPPPGGANGGQMATIGSLGLDTGPAVGFDIVGTANGIAYAALSSSPSGKSVLYSIDLASGAATPLGLLAQTKSYLVSITVEP